MKTKLIIFQMISLNFIMVTLKVKQAKESNFVAKQKIEMGHRYRSDFENIL